MQPKIEDILSYEIKKEIADRYFGFRKLIEKELKKLIDKAYTLHGDRFLDTLPQ